MSARRRLRRQRRHLPPRRVREVVEQMARFAAAHGADGIAVERQGDGWRLIAVRAGQPICVGCGAAIDLSIVLGARGLHRLDGKLDPIGITTCPLCPPTDPRDGLRGAA